MKPFLNKSSTFLRNIRFHWKNYLKLYLSPKHKGYFQKVLDKFLNIFHFRRQTAFFAVIGVVFVLGLFAVPLYAHADVWTAGTQAILGFIFELLFLFLGPLLTAIIASLVDVAKYNNIIGQTTIETAWTTVRDIVNMFFIFAILLIAFSTILRIHQYEAKQLLPKLVLYAVLVNFSLTICGIFIDIAQIFTLTFVSAFQDSAINNFTNITRMMDYASVQLDGPVGARDILAGYILGTALLVVSIVVIGALVLVLLARILFLWVLAILSPFAFVLPVIPGGQKYASQWWSMFSNYVISGPLLAFFIWLSLSVMSQQKIGSEIIKSDSVKIVKTTMGEPTFLLDYAMGMGMLIVGLILTQKLGGMMGSVAGGTVNRMRGAAMGAANWTRRQAWRGGAYAATSPFRAAAWGARDVIRRDIAREGREVTGPGGAITVQRSLLNRITARNWAGTGRITSRLTTGVQQQEEELERHSRREVASMTPAQRQMHARSWTNQFTTRGRALQSEIGRVDPGVFAGRAIPLGLTGTAFTNAVRATNSGREWLGISEDALPHMSENALLRLRNSLGIGAGDVGAIDELLSSNTNFSGLSAQRQNRMRNIMREMTGAGGGVVWTPGTARPATPGSAYRAFGEVSGEAEPSPNDITSGDMIVRANQVNVTGDKAGSTLGKDLGDPGKTSGVDSLLRRGLKDGVGRMAIDFNRLGLTGAGANLVGEGKAQMIPKLLEQLRKEGRTPAELQSIEKELQKAKSLSLINKTRDKGDARRIIAHEAVHDVLDDGVSVEERREMWGKMDPQKQAETEKKIRANWAGGDKMSQDQVIEEYLANGLTNETRWGDKSSNALKLDKSVQDELRKKGVFKKMNEGLVHRMSEKDIKTPDALKTEEEFRKHNEQVAAQVSGQVIHQTLTGKAQEESGEEEFEITGEGELEGKEEEEEKEEKKEEKPATEQTASKAPEASYRESDTQEKQIESATKHMNVPDAKFFKLMFSELGKNVGRLGSVVAGSGVGQGRILTKYLEKLGKASEHIESENPLEQRASQQEFDMTVNEIKKEFKEYDIINEAPSAEQGTSQEDIKKAINDLSNKS